MSNEIKLIINDKRLDQRNFDDLRNIKIDVGVLNEADGSAYIEWGGNKIIAGVFGPRECIPRHEANPYKALVKCRYSMAPFCSKEEHGKLGPSRRSIEISKVIKDVFEELILTELYPQTQIDIFIDVLQADGSTRVAAVTAAAVALADAGIPLKDMVSGVSVGKVDGKIVVDLNKLEDNYGESDMPIVVTARNKNIVLLQMDGLLTLEELKIALEKGIKASEIIHSIQINSLIKSYEQLESNGLEMKK